MVDTGSGAPIQVVCGAPNARAGMKGVFVPPGAFIPGKDMTLQVGTIRGVESRGMLVSEFELQISDNHEGIIELPDDAPVGASYAQWAGLDDPVIEINLTPNRADCTGVHGIARDLAAADMGKIQGHRGQAGQGRVSVSGECCARLRHHAAAVSRFRAASGARRQERAVARLAAKAAHCDRAATDQCARRYHQLRHLRPWQAAARVRCSQSAGQSRGTPRARRRDAARARRQDLHP